MHKHHLLPKYKGGTESQENLVEVTVTQHAMFHFCNWQLWGDKRDWLAWKGLKGEIPREEVILQLRRLGGQKGGKNNGERVETKERMRNLAKLYQSKASSAAATPEANEKRKKTLAKINHSQGERNSQFGTKWITDGNINKKIKKTDPVPEGYRLGRKLKKYKGT